MTVRSGVGSRVFTFIIQEVYRLRGHWLLIFFYKEYGGHVGHGFFLKYRSAVVEEKSFEKKQVFWLKIETMNEDWVKLWRVFVSKISRALRFVGLRGLHGLRQLG